MKWCYMVLFLIIWVFSISSAQEALEIQYGELATGQLNEDTTSQVYSFKGQAGDTVSITLRSDDFDPYLVLQDSDFQTLEENDDMVLVVNTNAAILGYELPIDGTYYIEVGIRENDLSLEGEFNLGLDGSDLYHQPPFAIPTSSDDYYAIALENFGLGLYEESVAALNRAVEFSPKDAKLYDLRSLAYDQLGNALLAQADLNRTIEIDPEYIVIYENRMRNYLMKNDRTSYLKIREQLLLLSPTTSVISGDHRLEIIRIRSVPQVPDAVPVNGMYLVFDIKLHNYSAEPWCITKYNFPAISDDTEIFSEKLYQIQQALYPERPDYPTGDSDKPRCLEFLEVWDTFIAYDLEFGIEELDLQLISAEQNLDYSLWLDLLPDQTYNFVLSRLDGKSQIEIGDIRAVSARPTVERILDSQSVSVENCFGTDTRETEVSFSQTITREVRLEASLYHETNIRAGIRPIPSIFAPLPVTLLKQAIGVSIEVKSTTGGRTVNTSAELNSIISSVSETLSAAAGTHTNYQVDWYLVSVAGEMDVVIDGQEFVVPFFIDDRIRSDVTSLPPTPCDLPTTEATP